MRFFYILLMVSFLSSTISVGNTLWHPVHISVINLELIENQDITFSVKLFKDDFSKILSKKNNIQIRIDDDTDMEEIREYVTAYVYEHFKMQNYPQINHYQLEKMKISDLAVWFYFRTTQQCGNIKKISIKNSLMTDLYQDQTNLFIMNYKDEDYTYSYNNSNKIFTFIFE